MTFEWDDAKNLANIGKHGISFDQARQVFETRTLDREDDRTDYGEKRIISLGLLEGVVVLCVTHTDRGGRIRIISARLASRRERAIYHAAIQQAAQRGPA